MRSVIFICLFAACAVNVAAQNTKPDQATYRSRMAAIETVINRYFYDSATQYYKEFAQPDSNDKKWSYLWPLCGLIQAANEADAANEKKDYLPAVLQSIYAYNDTSAPAPGYNSYLVGAKKEDRFYDDNQWIGIACMDAFFRTGEKAYLAEGLKIYRFMMTGFDTVSGGGIYWKEGDKTTKNTCSNGPGILLALQLHKATNERMYLDTALLLFNWVNKYLLAPEGVYYDNVMLPSKNIDKRTYTYNTGTMLQANVMLYEATKEARYLQQAKHLAKSAYAHFYKEGRWPANYWFNVVLYRGYEHLLKHDQNKLFVSSFQADAERIWRAERNEQGMIGRKRKKDLLDQAAMLEFFARFCRL